MDESEAKKYLIRKGKAVTKENIKLIMTEGSIYGDPTADITW